MNDLDKILNVRLDSALIRHSNRESVQRSIENFDEQIFSHLGGRQRSLGELMKASGMLRSRIERSVPQASMGSGFWSLPKPLARELEYLSRSVADDVNAGRVSVEDAEDFERSFLETLQSDFMGMAPESLFSKTISGLKPVAFQRPMNQEADSSVSDSPTVWAPSVEDEELELPTPRDAASRGTVELPLNPRPLTVDEIGVLRKVFGSELDYEKIRVAMRSVGAFSGIPRTLGNTIHLPGDRFDDENDLIHEAAHVWQFQKDWRGRGGYMYAANSLWHQFLYSLSAGHVAADAYGHEKSEADKTHEKKRPAWDFVPHRDLVEEGVPWDRWNAEQQAEFIMEKRRLPGHEIRYPLKQEEP